MRKILSLKANAALQTLLSLRRQEENMKQQTFSQGEEAAPLAERLRPQTLDEIVGQEHLLG